MSRLQGWTREQLLVALKLYCEIPFGKMHSRNPEIIRYAGLIHRTPSALAMKLTNFASLDPKITSSGRRGLTGASQADRAIWEEMTSNWSKFAKDIAEIQARFEGSNATGREIQPETASYVGKTRDVVIQARIGQSFFRKAVLSAYEFKCCISGLPVPELLIASHILPWSYDPANRLNPRNGLCLSAIHDRAFDLGLITISSNMRVLLSTKLKSSKTNGYMRNTFGAYEDQPITLPTKFSPDAEFLKHHRESIFCP
jgi:hypothetical protein